MPAYTHTTLSQAINSLSLRLEDPGNIHWSVAELTAYVVEALRFWQSLTAFYRERQLFNTVLGASFYDLAALLTANNAFNYNVTDRAEISVMLYHLLEPQLVGAPLAWTGTDQFNLPQVAGALQRRRDRFLGDTGVIVNRAILNSPAPPISRILLPITTLDVRRAAWFSPDAALTWDSITQTWAQDQDTWDSSSDNSTPIWRDDELGAGSFTPGWEQDPDNPPRAFSVSLTPPVQMQLIPPPATNGQIDVVLVSSGPSLDPANVATLLSVPDDLSPGVKWGALADLLSADGQARDRVRAEYCEKRYAEAVELAGMLPSALEIQVNNVTLDTGSVFDLDAYMPEWQNSHAAPTFAGLVGRNMLGLGLTPDAAYSVTVDLVRNMPVPAAPTDYLQVGLDQVDPILDYAQHLACFKMGGNDFLRTMPLYQNLLRAAALQNSRIKAAAFYDLALRQPAFLQSLEVKRV